MPNVSDEPRTGRLALQTYSRRHEKKISSPRAGGCFLVPVSTTQNLTLKGNQMESKVK